ncbi:hypothetical protein [Halospeciosus flavus]|uniref:Uncharacterized protein n=1 Tax=Halospeciosus flavus TaxID=3032283 RepID=A0ABD5Z104_9EURY|nr:hypothetical protein [Halospeciosus flavus]
MNVTGTIAALGVALLFAVALFAMTVGELQVAGFCFLSASLLIYLRERYLVD